MRIKKSALLAANVLVFLSLYSGAQSVTPPLPFEITLNEETTLPVYIFSNQTTRAYYTVTDTTGGPFPADLYNYVKHLPNNVNQVLVDESIPDLCGRHFKLSPYGSCTLALEISGPVSSYCAYDNSENPCLFVCMSDGFTCAGTKDPIFTAAAALPIAGGRYIGNAGQAPMLAANTLGGSDEGWNFTIDSAGPLPSAYITSPGFLGTTCTANTCIGVGNYIAGDGKQYPMMAVSNQGGADNSWNYVLDSVTGVLPPGYTDSAGFNTVACSGDICVAGGQVDIGSNTYPMLAMSTKRGVLGSWTYVDTLTIAGSTIDGTFNSASCTDNVCIAGGQYNDGTFTFPILAMNNDITGMGTWSYVIDSDACTLPSDFSNNGSIKSVSCADNNCIAGGQYNNGVQNYPMLAINIDVSGSSSWGDYAIDSSAASLPSDCSTPSNCSGMIYGTSCFGDICTAAGSYNNGSLDYPMLAVNKRMSESGAWNYALDSTSTLPNDYGHQGGLYAISCSGDICAAGGQYYVNSVFVEFPILAVNTDVGGSGTWEYAIDSTESTLPDHYVDGGSFYGVTCAGAMCIAEGYYRADDSIYYPMLTANSQVNTGDNWAYPVDKGGTLPYQFNSDGLFCGTTAVCN